MIENGTKKFHISFRPATKQTDQICKYTAKNKKNQLDAALSRLEYLEDYFTIQKEAYDAENACECRLVRNGKFYCIQTDWKGLRTQKELLSVDVCRNCERAKVLFNGLGLGALGAALFLQILVFSDILVRGYFIGIEKNLAILYFEVILTCFVIVYFSYLFWHMLQIHMLHRRTE